MSQLKKFSTGFCVHLENSGALLTPLASLPDNNGLALNDTAPLGSDSCAQFANSNVAYNLHLQSNYI